VKPRLGTLCIAALTLPLLACSLFTRPAPPPSPSDEAATEEPLARQSPAPPTPVEPSPIPQSFLIADPHPSEGDLAGVLAAHAGRAGELGLHPFVEFSATWCPSCVALAESLDDPRMVDAFHGIYLIRLDYDEWERSLPGTDFRVVGVPTFYEVDASGLPTGRMLTGAAWGEDIVENMAPVLKDFFTGG
jgi:thiol-disulfide isomerase/thioredoxin